MGQYEMKTKPGSGGEKEVLAFLGRVSPENKRRDALELLKIFKSVTRAKPRMWGDSIIGFGKSAIQYADGRKAEWFLAGFSPRKQNFALYIMGRAENYAEILSRLGKHKTGKSCLYINKLPDIETSVLKELIRTALEKKKRKN